MFTCAKRKKIFLKNVVNSYSSVASSTALASVVGRHLRGTFSCDPREQTPCLKSTGDITSYISLAGAYSDLIKQALLQDKIIPLSVSTKRQLKRNYDLVNDLIGRYGSMLWGLSFAIVEYLQHHQHERKDQWTISDIQFYLMCISAGLLAFLSNADMRDLIKKKCGIDIRDRGVLTIFFDGIFGGIDSFLRWRGFVASIQGILNFINRTDQWVYSNAGYYWRMSIAGGWGLFSAVMHGALSPRASTSDLFPIRSRHKNNLQTAIDSLDAFVGSCFFAFFTFIGLGDESSIHKMIVSGGFVLLAFLIPLLYVKMESADSDDEEEVEPKKRLIGFFSDSSESDSDSDSDPDSEESPLNQSLTKRQYNSV